jgi:serine/threonine protein kinase
MSLDNSSSDDSSSYVESSSSDEKFEQSDNLNLEGNIINNYNIIYELGRGAYSIVWLCFNIVNNNFYALKVQNPKEYKDGLNEIKFVKNLPKNYNFNYLVDHFIEVVNNKKYLCSVWELCAGNLDNLIRKNTLYNNGKCIPFDMCINIIKQILPCIKVLHKSKYFHGDIKTDNILIKGINDRDQYLIDCYTKENFFNKYTEMKNEFQQKNNTLSKNTKLDIRKKVHSDIIKKIFNNTDYKNYSNYSINPKYLENIKVCLSDFGMVCHENDCYELPFGTRYYQSPEIILMGEDKCISSYPVDIWAIGCTLYELLSGSILFDPIKDSRHNRDYYHLKLINNTCGPFESGFLKKTKYYKKYFNNGCLIDCNNSGNYDRLYSKLNIIKEKHRLSLQSESYLNEIFLKTLQIDPRKRANIDYLLNHTLFK